MVMKRILCLLLTCTLFTGISIAQDQTISISSGDLSVENSILHAPFGKINIASVASPGEISLDNGKPLFKDGQEGGNITLSDESSVDVNGDGSVNVLDVQIIIACICPVF